MSILTQVNHIENLIRQTEISCHRKPGSVQLVAVSKGHSDKEIEQAFAAGISNFGESYLQESLLKIRCLASLPICWHFIGPIQSNKTLGIAHHFSWVHSVSRQKIAELLNKARPVSMPPLNICIQVNLDNEETKAGLNPKQALELAAIIQELPRLTLRGLMLIPKPQPNEELQYESFLRLTDLLDTINKTFDLKLDTLSMGMSGDLVAAIRAGSTMVRVGTAIFGERKRKQYEH